MDHLEIPLSRPDIGPAEEEAVLSALRSGRLSMGPWVERFETAVAGRAGRHHAVAVNSGTGGLDLVLRALGIGPGDEVITTPFSFIASANCILYSGATPVFVDICPKSLNMDPEKMERAITRKTRAIVAVETFGNPEWMDAYESIAARHEVALIEDCCEALGTTHKGRPCGSFGRAGVFGFYPNKQITTGEGGMIVTDDHRLAELCRSMRNQGRALGWRPGESVQPSGAGGAPTGSWLHHERLGFNFRMAEINAALGVAQMSRLDEIVKKRRAVAEAYLERLGTNADLILPTLSPESRMSWFVFVVRLATTYTREERDRVVASLRRHDLGAGDYFPCIHLQPFYRERFGFREGMFPIAESVSQRTIALPFYNTLDRRDIEIVSQTLELMIKRENLKRG
ncbi:MAG: DegT/DnrJ/EryC1/StrS family aminotransferase [Phycisphaeraceae bacterium]|nr:MAG: DegT/DnrJ/EryC1/StrS family aminotransferase [Phycisphaeraceae bacterium]